MKIEVGMYCRTTDGTICKVIEVTIDQTGWYHIWFDDESYANTPDPEVSNIKSASHNLIDLVDIYDVIMFENIVGLKYAGVIIFKGKDEKGVYIITTGEIKYYDADLKDKRIVTYEQLDRICYKVGE